jgi:hypothetical protein
MTDVELGLGIMDALMDTGESRLSPYNDIRAS